MQWATSFLRFLCTSTVNSTCRASVASRTIAANHTTSHIVFTAINSFHAAKSHPVPTSPNASRVSQSKDGGIRSLVDALVCGEYATVMSQLLIHVGAAKITPGTKERSRVFSADEILSPPPFVLCPEMPWGMPQTQSWGWAGGSWQTVWRAGDSNILHTARYFIVHTERPPRNCSPTLCTAASPSGTPQSTVALIETDQRLLPQCTLAHT